MGNGGIEGGVEGEGGGILGGVEGGGEGGGRGGTGDGGGNGGGGAGNGGEGGAGGDGGAAMGGPGGVPSQFSTTFSSEQTQGSVPCNPVKNSNSPSLAHADSVSSEWWALRTAISVRAFRVDEPR